MQDIKELNLKELEGFLTKHSIPLFHAKQIFSWIYKKQVANFEAMSDLSQALRKLLEESFYICGLRLIERRKSKDGTEKYLFKLKDGNLIEAVTIPTQTRITGCISSQAGCKYSCRFCASGVLGFKRNLSSGEILDQVLYLRNNSGGKSLTHIVLMGIGEPMDNFENVLKAIRMINSSHAFNIAARRITISTCGIVPAINKLADEELQIELSVSLHAADDKTRDYLMPVNKKYPLKELINACKEYTEKTNRQITFEYILLQGINSDLQNAKNLSTMLKDLRLSKVNLIPANPNKELNIEPPNKLEILFFRDFLLKQGLDVTLRRPRGQDIEAACGQLRLRYENK
jgi:23S rRNA (adenine2503-C2)-methyltransferase